MIVVILAGGESKRMGSDKAQLKIQGKTLVQIVYEQIKKQANHIVISGPRNYNLNIKNFDDYAEAPAGPSGALYTLLQELNDGQESGFFTVPVDTPNVPIDLCERLYGDRSAIASSATSLHPTFAWWMFDDLSRIFDQEGTSSSLSLKHMARLSQARHVSWSDETLFYNINSLEGLTAYLEMTSSLNKAIGQS